MQLWPIIHDGRDHGIWAINDLVIAAQREYNNLTLGISFAARKAKG